ncbi:hypothetical protein [Pseudactinotalea sp. Z1748]|uniref:hypothetical protein n=1 Tax=Pseudactinotalea sp. Z1748 TaxID=3413027 RepID=UPI003C7E1B34
MPALTLKDRLAALTCEDEEHRRSEGLREIFADLMPALRRQARGLCRINGVSFADNGEDVYQMVLEVAWKTMTDLLNNPAKLEQVPSLEQRLWVAARPVVRSEMDKAKSPASGMVSVQRRRREYQRTVLEMMGLGYQTPSVDEVLVATNQRLARLCTDAARQGMVVTARDVASTEVPANVDTSAVVVGDTAEGEAIATDMADRILAATKAAGELPHRAAAVLIGQAVGPCGDTSAQTVRLIGEQLGVSASRAKGLLACVRQCAEDALRASGYSSPAI